MIVQRQRRVAFVFGMCAGIHQQAVAVHLHVPGAGADAGAGIEIAEFHGKMKTMSVGPVVDPFVNQCIVGVERVGMHPLMLE